jgi:hypothetical protein
MLRGCRKTCPVGVDVFTVHKKTKDGVDLQRLIFDLRRVNLFFVQPWPCAMGSLNAMCGLDLSDRNLGRSAAQSSRPVGDAEWELVGLVSDVPDFFYRVLIPDEMTGWFWLQDVDPVELYEALLLEGIKSGRATLVPRLWASRCSAWVGVGLHGSPKNCYRRC